MSRSLSLLCAALAAPALLAQTPKLTPLGVGSQAPELKVSRWVKGGPGKIEAGKTTVVEFWATWCPPCRATIPHLTELAKKHAGKVSFIGVSVWERGKGAEVETKVDTFVKDMGPKMDYLVARDTEDGFMAKHWMEAASQRGIPAAFVVNGAGTVVWIGNPGGEELSQVLDQVVAGTFDLKASKAAFEKEQAEAKAEEEKEEAMRKALEAAKPQIEVARKPGDPKVRLASLDAALAQHPVLKESSLAGLRLAILAHTDPVPAQKALEEKEGLNLAVVLAEEEGLSKELCAQAAEKLGAALKAKAPKQLNEAFAKALFKAGKPSEAVAAQEALIAFAKERKAPPQFLERFEKDLKIYQGAVK